MAELNDAAVVQDTTDNGLVAATEEVVLTLPPVSFHRTNSSVAILAVASITMGATAGTVTPRIRRGTTTAGVLVGEANAVDYAINDDRQLSILAVDAVGERGDTQYVLTLTSTQTATFAAGAAFALVIDG